MTETDKTLDLVKEARMKPSEDLAKAWTQSGSAIQGITAYDLEAPAKILYPVLTPLRNKTPREPATGGIQANWRAVTGINTTGLSMGLVEGKRGGSIVSTTGNYTAGYVELGLEDYVTWKADLAARGFDDVKALAVRGLLNAVMIGEEKLILGGQSTYALTQPVISVTASDTGGALSKSTTFSARVVALTLDGYARASVTGGIVQTYTRTNTDSSTDTINGGSSQVSALSSDAAITSGSNNAGSIACTCVAVPGAVAYAWFWGTKGGDILLGAITTVNAYTITAVAAGTQRIADLNTATDYSADSYVFDGIIAQAAKTGSNAYLASLNGAYLTTDGNGGITEIDAALKSLWDNYRLSPSTLWVSSQEQKNISSRILAAAANSTYKFTFNVDQGIIAGGTMVRSYLNKYSMDGAKEIPIKIHPNMAPGTLVMDTDVLPYPLSNVANVMQMRLRRDYFQIEWPLIKRRWEYGVYFDGVLQHYFPPSLAVISNIGNG